ncbi:Capsule biosynthesis protein CapB [Enhygromyxa salina]|uniref:Capsule biosynthesis protein CapB n=2 Tax=Enhygromyxa salina TaxID=215803 RepID=A0A2S9XH42_9BACT|nr:Capsule biosynthesis protein CapB [Enhygromyxa salina]
MFIHAAPLGPQVEIYTFRPYGKATIWEQRDLLQLAAGLRSEVFLWECMALNPEYVDILQRGWMRDDFATITNTYPDHEDIQGPAGIDVATVVGRFIPEGNPTISSELGFNPVLRDSAQDRGAELIEVGDHDGDLLPDDLLGLFPYSEHPRNIALVAELARQLGIDDELAIVTMADYVYPDLGVLKFYPEVQVRGRTLSFVNGCSANERAGFLNNWRRTGCVELAAAADPARAVITVVNNRDDRVSRSEVFSRILVNDVAVDAHVLIGTNLAGLQIFLDRALDAFASEQELVDAEALAQGGAGLTRARKRLAALLKRVRAPVEGWWEQLATILSMGLGALGRRFDPEGSEAAKIRAHVEELRGAEGSHEFETVVAKLASDATLNQALREAHDHSVEDAELIHPHEVGRAADYDELLSHTRDRIARMVIAGRLAAKLESVLEARDAAALASLTAELSKAWVGLFRAQLIVVWDAGATGDQIIDQCARAVPPGAHVTIMGTQNIKGTGLDFIYRWQALDAVHAGLKQLASEDEQTRLDALRSLDAHSDFGFTDTGMLVARLPEFTAGTAQEASLRHALRDKASAIHKQKLAKLDSGASGAAAKGGKFWTWVEGWIDFIDGAVRYRQSRQLVQDLIDFRVSHNKMAVEMRGIYARAKGGWLGKALATKLGVGGKKA